MQGSLRIGRLFGISLEISYSWIIIVVLLAASLATTWFPVTAPGLSQGAYWILAILASLLLFASVLAHELAHSLVARAHGLPVRSITLFIFGGVSNIEREPRSPGVEFQVAVVGPLTSILIGAVAFALGRVIAGANIYVAAVLGYLGVSNLLLGVFNLIPGFPLDGGRVLRSILWAATHSLDRATIWAARVGQGVALLFILWGLLQFFGGNLLGGLWIGFIGWFLLSAAQQANQQVHLQALLRDVSVADVMTRTPVTAPPGVSVQQLFEDYMLPWRARAVPITRRDPTGDHLLGLVTFEALQRVPRDQWPAVSADQLMLPPERLHTVGPQQLLNDVLPLMARYDVNQLPVVEQDRLVGLLTRDAVLRYVEMRRAYGDWPRPQAPAGPRPGAAAQAEPTNPYGAGEDRTPAAS